MDDVEFLRQFEDCSLPYEQWTHRAHVKVAYLYLREQAFPEALVRVRAAIQRFNGAKGVSEGPTTGYSETTTHAFLHLVAATLAAHEPSPGTITADEFCDRHPQLLTRHILRLFYSEARRLDPRCKTEFVPPDLAPLPNLNSSKTDLDAVQRQSQVQFDRQSARYGKGHILADVSDVTAALARLPATSELSLNRALDVATGGGHTGLLLAEQGWNVTLADLSSAMLERAQEAARERGLSVATCQHPAESFPYGDGSFELVTCRVAAHHFSDVAAFVREVARVLVGGGHFLLIDGSVADDEPVAEAWLHEVEKLRDPSHHRFLSPRTWRELCEAAGLTVESSELFPFKQPDLAWYFETAATSTENRAAVCRLIREAPIEARRLFQLREEDGKTVWWWQRLTLVARN